MFENYLLIVKLFLSKNLHSHTWIIQSVYIQNMDIRKVLITVEIVLKKLRMEDAESLFSFELNNKDYFEKMVPTRGSDYYNFDIFLNRLKSLLEEQEKGISYFYLIKDKNDSIIGRVNLIDIDKSNAIGHLGYRVAEIHTGKGVARKALKLLLEIITEERIVNEILAKTTANNMGSQRVLVKNGFEPLSIVEDTIEMNNEKLKFVYFRWQIPLSFN